MLDAAESPGEIKVKGSRPAEGEAGPLCISQRGWDGAKPAGAAAGPALNTWAGFRNTVPGALSKGWRMEADALALQQHQVVVGNRCAQASRAVPAFHPGARATLPTLCWLGRLSACQPGPVGRGR